MQHSQGGGAVSCNPLYCMALRAVPVAGASPPATGTALAHALSEGVCRVTARTRRLPGHIFVFWLDDSMRSIGLLAVVTGTLVLASSCSDGSSLSDNAAPVANFELPACRINESCEFVSTSTDDAGVTGWIWDFNGDNTPDANTGPAAYTYTAAGAFDVSLTVVDAEGLSQRKTSRITIDPAPVNNTPPTAAFTSSCSGLNCTFANT